ERLLYVALTRAKHTLILAFDQELFAKKRGEIHSHSQMKWLQADKGQPNQVAFANIGSESKSCAVTVTDQDRRIRRRDQKPEPSETVTRIDRAAAIRNANVFVRKLNPSALAHDETAAVEEEKFAASALSLPRAVGPALQYGLWWHDFVGQMNW